MGPLVMNKKVRYHFFTSDSGKGRKIKQGKDMENYEKQ